MNVHGLVLCCSFFGYIINQAVGWWCTVRLIAAPTNTKSVKTAIYGVHPGLD